MTGTVTLHRVLPAPPERVYRAFLDAAALCKWLPPHGFTCTVHELEAKVGGRATVSSDSTPDAQATVSSVASTAEFTPNTVETEDQRTKLVYEVRLRVTTPAGDLKPGMPVTVTFS